MSQCIFCDIITHKKPEEFLYHSEQVVAFDDIAPMTPVHVLIIPRQHIASMNDMTDRHRDLLGEMMLAATHIAQMKNTADQGYKLLIRTGRDGGQEVPHVHLHLLGGGPLAENIKIV